jgi:hypothetical protein
MGWHRYEPRDGWPWRASGVSLIPRDVVDNGATITQLKSMATVVTMLALVPRSQRRVDGAK